MSAPGLFDQALAAFALHAVWQVPLLACATWLAVRVGRPKVRIAHALWMATLLLCVVAPLLSTWQGYRVARAHAQQSAVFISYSADDAAHDVPAMQRESAWLRFAHKHFNTVDGLRPLAFALPPHAARGIAALYVLLLLFACVKFGIAWRRARLLILAASADVPQRFVQEMREQCELMDCALPSVAMSDEVAGPLLAGVLWPTLLLPAHSADELSEEEVEAVLAHELSHLRRRDPLWHAVSSVMLLPVQFHPAAKWIASRIRQTREMACDADAVALMGSLRYADALLCVAERMTFSPAATEGVGLRLFDVEHVYTATARDGRLRSKTGPATVGLELFDATGAMEERMRSMMKNDEPMSLRSRWTRGIAAAAITATGVAGACMIQVQPALAAQQKDATAEAPKMKVVVDANDNGPALVSGRRVQKQLQDASRRLNDAETHAATDEDRNKIATAQQMLRAAQSELTAQSAPRTMMLRVDHDAQLESGDRVKIHLQRLDAQLYKVQLDGQKPRVDVKLQALQVQPRVELERSLVMITKLEPPVLAVSLQESDRPIKVSANVMAGNTLTKVTPEYPASAKDAKIQGQVVLHAIIDENGKVEQISVVSSPDSALSKSSIEAVQHWTYKPYLLNGRPTAVDTTINVNFTLAP
ncbi:M56 family metallopeptidase [Terriglobus roseus]|uniref:TonB family C-terminal domain-containing protein n=1 Tax=Terriglobus roseus TaxID=392734 RepID=A0A1G7FFT2_9BACT|nr:M56 family metallopeptidase [Terriglobus roseus]SDE74746.1 TonB family C-terminal domain-containing protein [Terriglobus roseus]